MSRCRRVFFFVCALALASGVVSDPRSARAAINFTAADTVPIASKPEFLASADLNRDHHDDIVVIGPQSNEMDVFLGSSTSQSRLNPGTSLTFGKTLGQPAIGDLNADNNLDVAVPDEGAHGVWILIGKGDGTFLPPYLVQVGRNPFAVAIANFDGLRNADLAVADRQQDKVFVLLNDGQTPPTFPNGPDFTIGDKPEVLIAADFNQDGHPDIVSLNVGGPRGKDVGVLIFDRVAAGFPVFKPVQNFVVGEKPEQLVAGDFNGDGVPDLAMLNRPRTVGNSSLDVLIANGVGGFNVPTSVEIPCPFFTGGLFCRAVAIALGDFDGNVSLDMAIVLNDPRRFSTTDAMQIFSGRGEGGFVPGTVISVGKAPGAVVTGDVNGDGPIDLAVATKRQLALQAFINVSTPGSQPNGSDCILGDVCLSGRCTNGVCCASECFDFEQCNVPLMEGICTPVITPVDCTLDADCDGTCADDPRTTCTTGSECGIAGVCLPRKCQDGFCCAASCNEIDDRCNVPDFEGICIPKLQQGDDCDDDSACLSGFCRNAFCCNQDCQEGVCNVSGLEGICQPRLPLGEFCNDDDTLCASGICDDFDSVCCNRVCDSDEFCNEDTNGLCTLFPPTDVTQTPATTGNPADGTPTPTPTKGTAGDGCEVGTQCNTSFCVNGVCCLVDEGTHQGECDLSTMHCESGTGNCVNGTPVATRTRTATVPVQPSPTSTPGGGGGPCDPSCPPANCAPDGTCILTSRSGGCSTTNGTTPADAVGLMLVPVALWLVRRQRNEQRLALVRARQGSDRAERK